MRALHPQPSEGMGPRQEAEGVFQVRLAGSMTPLASQALRCLVDQGSRSAVRHHLLIAALQPRLTGYLRCGNRGTGQLLRAA